jgi:outer membrane protein assembly factor BamB
MSNTEFPGFVSLGRIRRRREETMKNNYHSKPLLLAFAAVFLATCFSDSRMHLYPLAEDHVALAGSNYENLPQGTTNTILYLPFINISQPPIPSEASWPTVAANPERTSWAPQGVSGSLHLEWYRTFQAYIPPNFQIIAAHGKVYISSAEGLYALDAATGDLVWRFDTELPLGNSPTVSNGVVYVAGYDRKLNALDATTGAKLWSFDGATAGYDANPLVVENKVIIPSRDGTVYAIGTNGTAQQGQLIWKYRSGGSIHLSPAYKDGKVFFAANDNYAYALDVSTGALIWKSAKLPGDGYHSWWPVIFNDKVIFSAATGYRVQQDPGTASVKDLNNNAYWQYYYMERDDIFPSSSDGTLLGSQVSNPGWGNGYPVLNASRITEYLENNPNTDRYKHKPWRRMMIVLNQSNGTEYTFDSDRDGYPEYLPVANWGSQSGNRYPPIVGPDGILYVTNIYQKLSICQGRVMGWNINTPSNFSVLYGQGAVDEPQAISGGGNNIYRALSSGNTGESFGLQGPDLQYHSFYWSYGSPLSSQAPGYDDQYWKSTSSLGTAFGNSNGIYRIDSLNPIIPYNNRLYILRGNSILAYGSGPSRGRLPLITANNSVENITTPTVVELSMRLETEVQKIIDAGHLRPGYYNNGFFTVWGLVDYFDNPGDTLYTLSRAYPYLSENLKAQTKAYLRNEFQLYFDPTMYSMIGWSSGAAREDMPLPNDILNSLTTKLPRQTPGPNFTWAYPPQNFYALWKYALIFPEDTARIYQLAKSKIQVPVPAQATNQFLSEHTWEHNAYIAGYTGFLQLQSLAGMTNTDSQLRQSVNSELNRLLQLRVSNFTKNSPWVNQGSTNWHLNIARNFIWLVPELGSYMRTNLYNQVRDAIGEYVTIAPYWFVSRFENAPDEGIMSTLYNYGALFQAKAYILGESRSQLTKYLDVPAFGRGDLFYIQNLITAIEATP